LLQGKRTSRAYRHAYCTTKELFSRAIGAIFAAHDMNATLPYRASADLMDEKYAAWKTDPRSVETTRASFFEGFELGMAQRPGPGRGLRETVTNSRALVWSGKMSISVRTVPARFLGRRANVRTGRRRPGGRASFWKRL
jgi:hypothetical protein